MKKHSIFFLLAAVFGLCFSVVVFAQDDYGLGATAGAAGLQRGDVPTLAGNVIGTALSIIGVLFFILMIYGGFLWMTARGNEEQTKKASQTITAAVIGMVIILASYAITSFVFEAVKGDGSEQSCATPTGGFASAVAVPCNGLNIGDTCTPPSAGPATCVEITSEPGAPAPHCHCQ